MKARGRKCCILITLPSWRFLKMLNFRHSTNPYYCHCSKLGWTTLYIHVIVTFLEVDMNADVLFMVALCNRAYHIYFHAVSSSFFISSPNLSGRRLDVCHTSTHGVALVQI